MKVNQQNKKLLTTYASKGSSGQEIIRIRIKQLKEKLKNNT